MDRRGDPRLYRAALPIVVSLSIGVFSAGFAATIGPAGAKPESALRSRIQTGNPALGPALSERRADPDHRRIARLIH
jgi:hypothetical protein